MWMTRERRTNKIDDVGMMAQGPADDEEEDGQRVRISFVAMGER